MSGVNTTGKPNTEDYNLGRGVPYFAEAIDISAGTYKAWRDLGNAPAFTITTDSETLQHFSSRTGLKTLDREVTLQRTMNVGFTLDEWNNENLAMTFSGSQATPTNSAIAGFAEWEMVPAGANAIEKGRWYDIKNSAGVRAYDIDAVDLTVKTTNGTPVTLALNTDYELDLEMGMIFLLSTSTEVATAITNNEGLDVTLAAKAEAKTLESITGLTKTEVKGKLKFISSNAAADGFRREYLFHQTTLKADGDLALIGDDWGLMQFTGAAEKDANGNTVTIINLAA